MKNKTGNVNSYDGTHDITPEEVRQFERFKNYTDEQVAELINTIKTYTRFIYNVCSKRQKSGRWKDGLLIEKNKQVVLIKFNRENQCIDLFADADMRNFSLQLELTEFIVLLPKKAKGLDKHRGEENSAIEHVLGNLVANQLESISFKVLISNDGSYFCSWKDVISNRLKGIYNVEAIDANNCSKIFSVFDFNRFLPKKDKGFMKNIFISYSKLDLGLVNKFIEHLAALKLDGIVGTWYCTELTAGSDWNSEIQKHFDDSDIICFMISSNFMKTKYIHEHEIEKAFKRKEKDKGFVIVPILLDFCRWSTTNNNLAKYTALPYTAKPVVDFKNQNKAWYIIEECLRIMIERSLQPEADAFSSSFLPEDVKKIYEQIVNGSASI